MASRRSGAVARRLVASSNAAIALFARRDRLGEEGGAFATLWDRPTAVGAPQRLHVLERRLDRRLRSRAKLDGHRAGSVPTTMPIVRADR